MHRKISSFRISILVGEIYACDTVRPLTVLEGPMTMTTLTPLDPRPSPAQVHAWLATDLSDGALRALVAVLDTDPNWCLSFIPGPTTWDGDLRYSPQGLLSHVHLVRRPPTPTTRASRWQRVPRRLRPTRPRSALAVP